MNQNFSDSSMPSMPSQGMPVNAIPQQPINMPFYPSVPAKQWCVPSYPSADEDMMDEEYQNNLDNYSTRQNAIVTNPTPIPGTFLFKELTGYPNYGMPSGSTDILYTRNRGVWTFNLPSWLPSPRNLIGQLRISAVLDDHANVPVTNYSLSIAINGIMVRQGPIALQHGTPAGGRFTNWRVLTYGVPNLRVNNRIVITNTSNAGAGDWIGIDWMELRLFYR